MPRPESNIWNTVLRSADRKKWKCSYCGDIFAGNSYRVKCHLIGGIGIKQCPQSLGPIPQQLIADLKEEREVIKSQALVDKRRSTAQVLSTPAKQMKITDNNSRERTRIADRAVARCIYSNGLAFQLADKKSYREMCQVSTEQ